VVSPLVLEEVFQLYEALCQRQDVSLAPCCPFKTTLLGCESRTYLKPRYSRQALSGVQAPLTNLEVENLSSQEERYDEQQIKLSAATTAALQSLARQHQLTLNTLFQGLAVLLSRYSCENQVVYGCGVLVVQ